MERDVKEVPWQHIPLHIKAAVWPWLVRSDGITSWWLPPRVWQVNPFVDALVMHAPPNFSRGPRWLNPRLDMRGATEALWLTRGGDPDEWDHLYQNAPVIERTYRAIPGAIDWCTSHYGRLGTLAPFGIVGLEPFINRDWPDWVDSVVAHYAALVLPEEGVQSRSGQIGYRFSVAGKPVYWRGSRVRVQAYAYQGPNGTPRYEIQPLPWSP